MNGKPLTGRKVLAILVGAFGIIIVANVAMLLAATGTFPGLVVDNSYVASQQWNAKTDAQIALGWRATVEQDSGALKVVFTGPDGALLHGLNVNAVVGRPASGREDVTLALADEAGAYAAPMAMGPGLWRVAVAASDANGAHFEAETELFVPEPR